MDEKIQNQAAVINEVKNAIQIETEIKIKREQLSENEKKIEQAFQKLEQALKREPEIQLLGEKIVIAHEKMPMYDKLDHFQIEIGKSTAEIFKLETELVQTKKKYVKTTEELETDKLETEKLLELELELQKSKLRWQELEDKYQQLFQLQKEQRVLIKLVENYKQAVKRYQTVQKDVFEFRSLFQRLEQEFMDGQAGILSQVLVEGAPCPVCGSTVHPQPAVIKASSPTREQWQEAKEQLEMKQNEMQEKNSFAAALKGQVEEKQKNLQQAFSVVYEEENTDVEMITQINVGKDMKAMELQKEEIYRYQKQLELQVKSLKKKKEEIPAKEEMAEQLQKKIQASEMKKAAKEIQLQNLVKQREELKGTLEYGSKQELQTEIARMSQYKEQLKKGVDTAKNEQQEALRAKAALEGEISALTERMRQSQKGNLQEELDLQKRQLEEKKILQQQQEKIAGRLEKNSTALNNIREKSGLLEEKQIEYGWMKALNDTANGRQNEKGKIMLETYVQMAYFERILDYANIRLEAMTGGQYTLIRKKEAENNRSQSGLDLEVIDHYNGSVRHVKTLSGGESFKASLCLALGLSDEIQATAGGVRLDTMFVDEGFGSLDEESLSQALQVLSSLSGEDAEWEAGNGIPENFSQGCGNRLVGIISHVEELKQRIPKQILVTKTKTGFSKARIVDLC